jgi:hypothetical protein
MSWDSGGLSTAADVGMPDRACDLRFTTEPRAGHETHNQRSPKAWESQRLAASLPIECSHRNERL